MWCDRCQADVKAEAAASGGAMRCAQCGQLLGSSQKHNDAIRQARAILERWQSNSLIEEIHSTPDLPPLTWGHAPAEIIPSTATESSPPFEVVIPDPDKGPERIEKPAPSAPNAEDLNAEDLNAETPAAPDRVETEFEVAGVGGITEPDEEEQSGVYSRAAMQTATEESAETIQLTVQAFSASVAGANDSTTGEMVHPESEIPAETAGQDLSKKSEKRPIRRPRMFRRYRRELPDQASTTGSATVNRKLRVDQPKGDQNANQPESGSIEASAAANGSAQTAGRVVSSVAPDTRLVSNSGQTAGRRIRIDDPVSIDHVAATDGTRTRTQGRPKRRYIDSAHESGVRGPHFEVSPQRRSNLTSLTGQFLAYIGVLGLTVGTAIVIYGHFGGYSDYTPTGWLVTTVAQMLLFLGVINLVSGGIEQNNDEVSRRINTLGEQLLRIEHVTEQALRGPKLPPKLYANPEEAEANQRVHETAE